MGGAHANAGTEVTLGGRRERPPPPSVCQDVQIFQTWSAY
ncbi:hypothetical protein BN2537_4571 [Streptomyces venezuelae]|nr:hypothetical protein BN2537_4571 [Streptomyces venezuelae]